MFAHSTQWQEGKAPGYPLGFGWYGVIEPVRVVGNDDDGDEDDDSGSDGGPPRTVDADRKRVPLYGRELKILLGNN